MPLRPPTKTAKRVEPPDELDLGPPEEAMPAPPEPDPEDEGLVERAREAHEKRIRQPWPLQPDPIPDPLDLHSPDVGIPELERFQMLAARWVTYLEAEVAFASEMSFAAKYRAEQFELKSKLSRPKSEGSETKRRWLAERDASALWRQHARAHIVHGLLEGRLRGLVRLDDRISRILTARLGTRG